MECRSGLYAAYIFKGILLSTRDIPQDYRWLFFFMAVEDNIIGMFLL